MSHPAPLDPTSACIIAPEDLDVPERPGLWVVDVRGLDEPAARARVERFTRYALARGAAVVALGGARSVDARTRPDLTDLLRRSLRGLELTLTLPTLVRYVPPVRRFIAGRIGDRFGARAAFTVELVLDELCLNAIEHGNPYPSRFSLELGAEASVFRFAVSNEHRTGRATGTAMRDRVERFDASGAYLEERGRGLFLVARMVDGLDIDAHPDQVRVQAWKDLRSLVP